MFSPNPWCWCTFLATRTSELHIVTLLLFYSAWSFRAQLPLLSFSSPCLPRHLLVVQWVSTSGRVLHLTQEILWLPVEIAALCLKSVLLAISGSPEICLSPSISLCVPPQVVTEQLVWLVSPSSFCPTLVSPVFLVSMLQLFPPDHPHLWPQAPLPLLATVWGHQHLHSLPQDHTTHWNQTVVSTLSSRWLVLLAGCWWASSVNALMCLRLSPWGIWHHIHSCSTF